MKTSPLKEIFLQLRQGSKLAVQNGQQLTELDLYLHIERPIDKAVRDAMKSIQEEGGGLVMLAGSAGDGKSHMISTLKREFPDFLFHNDASESPSYKMDALEVLKRHIAELDDTHIHTTSKKILVAINIGKLSTFIDDQEAKEKFSLIVKAGEKLLAQNYNALNDEKRIKVITFANQQIFELYPEKTETAYPVDSKFIRTILDKITKNDKQNPFYRAYIDSKPVGAEYEPVFVNYELLSEPAVQDSIVKIIIEAIVRLKLMVTPRELLDFISHIIVPEQTEEFKVKDDFFWTLLPTRLFSGGENKILKSVTKLDPVKHGSIAHNDKLSDLFTNPDIGSCEVLTSLRETLHPNFFYTLQEFISNNRKNIEEISILLLRLEHVLDYHAESETYRDYLQALCGYYNEEDERLDYLYDLIKKNIPRYYGAYIDDTKLAPLSIQGPKYKLFSSIIYLKESPCDERPFFSINNRSMFETEIKTAWKTSTNSPSIRFKVDFNFFTYLSEVASGKLQHKKSREKCVAFRTFINQIIKETEYQEELIILTPDNNRLTLCKKGSNRITLR